MKPFSHRAMTNEERMFNYRLSRALLVVKNSFGILAHRWRCMLGGDHACWVDTIETTAGDHSTGTTQSQDNCYGSNMPAQPNATAVFWTAE